MANNTTVKIFIASSAELQVERKQCVLLLNQLGENYPHLVLKPVEWEYSLIHGNYPGHDTVQSAINPMLQGCQLVIFIFHTKIGPYTREEFEFSRANNIRLFAYFKQGFSPRNKDQMEAYLQLLEFKESLNETVLYKEYDNPDAFQNLLLTNLGLYLSQTYPATATGPSEDTSALIKMLSEKEQEIKQLKQFLPSGSGQEQQQLEKEMREIRLQLSQSTELIEKQAKYKEELEKQLASQKDNDGLKAQALEEVKKGNYTEAEIHLKTFAAESIAKVSSTFYQLSQIKELQLQYLEAFKYCEQAVSIDPENSSYFEQAGYLADMLGYYDKAVDFYEKFIAAEANKNGEEHPPVAAGCIYLSTAFSTKGNFDKAIEYGKKALGINRIFYTERTLQIALSYSCLATAYESKGDYAMALEFENQALEIFKKLYGGKNVYVASSYCSLGLFYNGLGDYEKGIEFGKKALDIYRNYYGNEHPNISLAYNNIGESYQKKGQLDKAIDYYGRSLHLKKMYFPGNHPYIARTKKNLAQAEDEKRKLKQV